MPWTCPLRSGWDLGQLHATPSASSVRLDVLDNDSKSDQVFSH